MTVILLRHGRSTSNTAHTLAGRTEGVDLDDKGREQSESVIARIGELPVKAIVRSPLLRCERTVAPLAAALGLTPVVDDRLSVRRLVAGEPQRVQRQRVLIRGGALLLDQAAEHAQLERFEAVGVHAVQPRSSG